MPKRGIPLLLGILFILVILRVTTHVTASVLAETIQYPAEQETATNLALKRPTVDQTEGSVVGVQIVDGDYYTSWDYSPNYHFPHWLYVDLGARAAIEQVQLWWLNVAAAGMYRLEISDNAQTWQIIYEETQSNGNLDTVYLSATGRYIRLALLSELTEGQNVRLTELVVLGTLLEPIPPTPSLTPSLTPTITLTPLFPSGNGPLLFSDDFNDGNADGWQIVSGSWFATAGNLRPLETCSGTSEIVTGESTWSDYEFSFDWRHEYGNYLDGGVLFRYSEQGSYFVTFYYDQNNLSNRFIRLYRIQKPGATRLLAETVFPFKSGEWLHLRIKAYGDHLQVVSQEAPLNQVLLNYRDPYPLRYGKIGFRVTCPGIFYYDSPVVHGFSQIAPTPTLVPPVTPTPIRPNLAQLRPVVASSGTPEAAVDSNYNTFWESSVKDSEWLYVDLTTWVNVTEVQVLWQNSAAKRYRIEVSGDTVAWHTIYEVTDGDGWIDSIPVSGQGRYLRIYGLERNLNQPYSIVNLAVFGNFATAPTPTPTATPSSCTDCVVTNLNTSGPGSLSQALFDAVPGATIRIEAQGTIQTGRLDLNKNLTIYGYCPMDGSKGTTLSGGGQNQVLMVRPGVIVTLSCMTITGGKGDAGGGIFNQGDLTLQQVNILNNTATTESTDCLGAGIYNAAGATLKLRSSLVAQNTYNYQRCSYRVSQGGGIYSAGNLSIINSTIGQNAADDAGGGLYITGPTALSFLTLFNNTAPQGGNIYSALPDTATIQIKNSIVMGKCQLQSERLSLSGNNFADTNDSSCLVNGFNWGMLPEHFGQLRNNGGSTLTYQLSASAPVVDAVTDCTSIEGVPAATDQRIVTRPADGNNDGETRCDAGAVEIVHGELPTTPTPPYTLTPAPTSAPSLTPWPSTTPIPLAAAPPTLSSRCDYAYAVLPSLSWNGVANGIGYQLQIDNNYDFSSLTIDTLTYSQTYTPEQLAEGSYYWRVRAFNQLNNAGGWSNSCHFILDTQPPAIPAATYPLDGAIISDPRPDLSYYSEGAVQFEVQFSTSNPPTDVPTSMTYYSSLKIQYPLNSNTYYWRVRAIDRASNTSEWSPVFRFTVASSASALPGRTLFTTSRPVLNWGRLDWATGYEIQINKSSAFGAPQEFTRVVDAQTFSVQPTLADGVYYWRVRARRSDGSWGAWSAAETFTIDWLTP